MFPSLLTRLQRTQHVTALISSCGNHAIATKCLVKNVPPASGGRGGHRSRHMQVSSFLQQYMVDDLLLVAILTYNITIHIIRLPLKESCFEINVEKIATFAGCHFGKSSEILVLWTQENRFVGFFFFLFILES